MAFTVQTSSSLPPGFYIKADIFLQAGTGDYTWSDSLTTTPTSIGTFTGSINTFDMRTQSGLTSAPIAADLEIVFPPTGTTQQDSALVRSILKSLTFDFHYRVP